MIDGFKVYVKSFGCPTNVADGEVMVGCLLEAGYSIVDRVEDADVLVFNTCAVKTPTENRMMQILSGAPRGKKIVVTGCLPLINFERLKKGVRFDGVLGPAPGSDIVGAMREVASGKKVVLLEKNSRPSLFLPKVPVNRVVGIVPISYGCLGLCSYCCVLFARGRLRSYSIGDVVERVKRDLAFGAREIWLTSQDTACYGKDIGFSLVDLLREICAIDGEFFVRVGMMTPNYVLEMLDDLVQVYKDGRVFKFLHLPVQSGDDEVLRFMNRFYSVEDFKKIVYSFRGEVPEITVTTDVICGFPGESQEAFERTVELVEEVQPDIVNISKFFPRPRTLAEKMGSFLHPQEVKSRSRRLAELVRRISFEKNRVWMNWEGRILVDEKGKRASSWVGRNFAYKPVVVKSDEFLFGRFVKVRIVGVFPTYLEGEII